LATAEHEVEETSSENINIQMNDDNSMNTDQGLQEQLKDLQRSLANEDMATRPYSGLGMELLVLKFLNISIRMDRNENHARPHFHIDYGNSRHCATYAVDTGERLVGTLPSKYDRLISAWAIRNSIRLIDLWDRMRSDVDFAEVLVVLRADEP